MMLRAVDRHVMENWQRLYIKRRLQTPVQHPDGSIEHITQGIPQGGVISPLLANLYLHYVFDMWMAKHYPQIPFVRYADDIVCHCRTQQEAEQLQNILIERFEQCRLELNHQKTKIVHCRSWKYNDEYGKVCFNFLGFTFRPRLIKTRLGKLMVCFLPAISQKASKQIRDTINSWAWTAWIHMDNNRYYSICL